MNLCSSPSLGYFALPLPSDRQQVFAAKWSLTSTRDWSGIWKSQRCTKRRTAAGSASVVCLTFDVYLAEKPWYRGAGELLVAASPAAAVLGGLPCKLSPEALPLPFFPSGGS